MKNDIFNRISPNEALEILREISKTDKIFKKRIVELAEEKFRNVDVDDICELVFDTLDSIDVHELWDRSGARTDGYSSPEEMSGEMFEEAIEPYIQEMNRLLDLKLNQEAKLYCMGILNGIYKYHEDSRSEFKDWATDIPGETFGSILRKWGKNCHKNDKKEMELFISKKCPDWFDWAKNQI